jgi:hypothetical protein
MEVHRSCKLMVAGVERLALRSLTIGVINRLDRWVNKMGYVLRRVSSQDPHHFLFHKLKHLKQWDTNTNH